MIRYAEFGYGWNKDTDEVFPLKSGKEALPYFKNHALKRVVATAVDGYWVSTVFLVFDHSFRSSTPALFETMVFLDGHGVQIGRFTRRCSTAKEAREGHEKTVIAVKAWLQRAREEDGEEGMDSEDYH